MGHWLVDALRLEPHWTQSGTVLLVALWAAGLVSLAAVFHLWTRLSRQRAMLADRATALESARREARYATRTKSEFLANMSHEVRTPINVIFGMIDIAEGEGPLNELQRDSLERARKAARSLLSLIDGILDLSKIEAGELAIEDARLSPRAVLGDVAERFRDAAEEKRLRLELHLSPDLPVTLIGDPRRLHQVAGILVGNAVKFTERGTVKLAARFAEEDGGRTVLAVEVRDTGIGIARPNQEKIFAAFTQADTGTTRKYGGAGLGLALAHQLVALMGGRLDVESEPGEGSRFWFAVPMQVVAEPRETGAALAAPPLAH